MSLIKLKNNALDNLTSFEGSASLGDMVLVSSATASSSASIEFTLGDYKEYKFFFVNIHPQNDGVNFGFNMSIDGGSNYNVTKTTTWFRSQQRENGTDTQLNYDTGQDLAQSTSDAKIGTRDLDNDSDSSNSGYLHLFNPSSTTYVKHFICNMQGNETSSPNYSMNAFCAGYGNTTNAIDSVIFRMSSGNIDDGKILMFGLN